MIGLNGNDLCEVNESTLMVTPKPRAKVLGCLQRETMTSRMRLTCTEMTYAQLAMEASLDHHKLAKDNHARLQLASMKAN